MARAVHQGRTSQRLYFLRQIQTDKDEENLVLFRDKLNLVIMNLYPYNPGHLMVAPYRHLGRLEDLTTDERNEHYALVSKAVSILREVSQTDNFNIGMNLGRVAGAGIEDHVHTHIVPRWNGDNNFMPVIAETRVISESMQDIYNRLKVKF